MIDLRSDTVTLPTDEMLKEIDLDKLGDASREDLSSRGEDLHVIDLEDEMASLLGFESSLFFHNGTSANICMVKSVCTKGSHVIIDDNSHIFQSESVLFDEEFYGMVPLIMDTYKSETFQKDLERTLSTTDVKLVSLEIPNAFYSGAVIPKEELERLYNLCRKHDVHLHIDGARIFNAMANGYMENESLGDYCDTAMISFSKGLGAPMGGMLCGSKEAIYGARYVRKRNGMHMRQGGVIAAIARASTRNIGQLKRDNLKAEKIRTALESVKGLHVERVEECINIVQLKSEIYTNRELLDLLAKDGILLNDKKGWLRLYTHRHITEEDVETVIHIIAKHHSKGLNSSQ